LILVSFVFLVTVAFLGTPYPPISVGALFGQTKIAKLGFASEL
jgi:hypothetical protein